MFKGVHLKSQAFSAAIPISSNHACLRARLRCKYPIVINTREHFSKVRARVESESIHTDIRDHNTYLCEIGTISQLFEPVEQKVW